jgi:hypothetical protein
MRDRLVDTVDAALRRDRVRGVPERRDVRRRRARRIAVEVLADGWCPTAFPQDPGLSHAAQQGAAVAVGLVQAGRHLASAIDRFVHGPGR